MLVKVIFKRKKKKEKHDYVLLLPPSPGGEVFQVATCFLLASDSLLPPLWGR